MNYVVLLYVLLFGASTVALSTQELGFRDLNSTPTQVKAHSSPQTSSSNTSSSGSTSSPFLVGSTVPTVSTFESTYTNWVGPVTRPLDTACYREAHIGKTCPLEFNSKLNTCWAQCPITFPVKCGMECIRQNDDCKLEVVSKVVIVFQSAIAMAMFNLYGEFKLMAKVIQTAFRCAKEMAILVKNLTRYVRYLMATDPQTSQAKILAILYRSDKIVFDLPVTIATCMGIVVKPNIRFADKITNTAELVLQEVMTNADSIVESWDSFKAFMSRVLLGESIADLKDSDITSLKSSLKSNTTCGYDMKRLADHTWMTVLALRSKNPEMSENELRIHMSKSSLVLNDIPTATNNCMEELITESDEKTAYATRTTLRKTFGVIVEDLIKSGTSDNGTYLNAEEYALKIADKALTFYGVWDIKGVTQVLGEYVQTICGPTKFIGEIDDGPADKALGLKTVGKAFNGSYGVWAKESDGEIKIDFQSSDTKDVTVNILSAGDKIDEVEVSAGGIATWTANVTALGGKTLYLDRWRPGILGLPGTGGGSASLWIPRSTSNGHLELKVKLNVS